MNDLLDMWRVLPIGWRVVLVLALVYLPLGLISVLATSGVGSPPRLDVRILRALLSVAAFGVCCAAVLRARRPR